MAAKDKQPVDELSEDMEVVGPGQMLSEARKKIALSVEDVAEKLKFKKCLVQNIEQDIFDHCRELLTNYKRPKLVTFLDELPKTNVGKVLRKELR